MITKKLAAAIFVVATAFAPSVASAGVLFVGTDNEEFTNSGTSVLVKATVSGAAYVSQVNIPLGFNLNGLGDGPGFLFAGEPDANTLRTIDEGARASVLFASHVCW